MLIDSQRLRNLTTGRLHTEMTHIYDDIGWLFDMSFFTHQLPSAYKVILPWLKENVKDPRYFDGKYDVTHVGSYDLPEPTEEDRRNFLRGLNE